MRKIVSVVCLLFAAMQMMAASGHVKSVTAIGEVLGDGAKTTGQSMGCMMTYLLMSKHSSLFTAGLLVAGHWRASDLAPMAEKPLWLVSSAGASKTGAEQAIAEWQQHGGVAATAEWPLTATDAERGASTADLLAKSGNIHYAHLTSGSHFDTWRVAYSFRAVRDWLFSQHK
jgi:predicted peptidase